MSRTVLAVAAATILCALVAPNVASAQTPLTQKVAVTGSKGFKGTYTIERFVAKGNQLYAVGDLTGKVRGKKVTKRDVRMPAAVSTPAKAAQVPPIPGACQILNLSIAPINLNLLGLSVRTNQIDLRIEAVPGAGNLLGNLLCGITNILNPGQLPNTPLGQLAQILNAILALLPRTA
jgi:hypothetical protein